MKSIRIFTIVLMIMFVTRVQLFSGAGTDGMQNLRISPSPVANSMADTSVSLIGNVNNMVYNPAGAYSFSKFEIGVNYVKWISSMNFFNGNIKIKAGNIGDIGVGFSTLLYDDITKITYQNGELVTSNETVDLNNYNMMLNYSKQFFNKLTTGINIKLVSETIDTVKRSGVGFDIGMIYNIIENMGAGVSVGNIGLKETGMTIRGGVNYRISFGKNILLIVSGEGDKIGNNDLEGGIGAEVGYGERYYIRGGYRISKNPGNFRIGAGIKYHKFVIDYSFNSYSELGYVSRVGVKFLME